MKTYRVNEVFCSIQGEGIRTGTANVFIRLSGCNQKCVVATHGFDCDTEFVSGVDMMAHEVEQAAADAWQGGPNERAIVFTGGEPCLQLDAELLDVFQKAKPPWYVAVETNGSVAAPAGLDWVTVSPKVAEHAIKQRVAHEVKYVRGVGQGIPKTVVAAQHYLISPAFNGVVVEQRTLDWCVKLVKENPPWRLSLQTHKWLGVR